MDGDRGELTVGVPRMVVGWWGWWEQDEWGWQGHERMGEERKWILEATNPKLVPISNL